MPSHPNPGTLPDEEEPHQSEGLWYRFRCGACDTMNEVEEDPRTGQWKCEDCGYEAEVEGEY
jgi:hypothetical protein